MSGAKLASSHSHTILVIEDDESIREILGEFLEHEGHRVELLSNGREALERLKQSHDFCLIFLDLQMPILDGRGFMREIAALKVNDPYLAAIPIYVFSAERDHGLYKELGCAGWVQKPVDLSRIRDIVDHAGCC